MKFKNIARMTSVIVTNLIMALPVTSNAVDAPRNYNSIERLEFNRVAAEHFLPLFWREDSNKDDAIQPDELAVLIGFGKPHENERSHWIDKEGNFTSAFTNAYRNLVATRNTPPASTRLKLLKQELAQGRTTLIETDLQQASVGEIKMVKHLMKAASHIENIYQQQKGTFGLDAKIPSSDLTSRMVFYRNQSPFCEAPKTATNPKCNALEKLPDQLSGLYPASIQKDKAFCETLAKAPNAADLTDHFSVVIQGDRPGTFKSETYNLAFINDMESIALELEAAADALDDSEVAFKNYLHTDAQSFRTNDWEPANRAWVAMNATNSKWYARIAPDEVYYEPCAWKAGFALQLARINKASLTWQQKLEPMKNEMEQTLAEMAGPPYKARDVKFKVPDFIDVVINAGDQRSALTATIGESLPNWGPVAESGGRTVAMTNLFQDADSLRGYSDIDSALFCSKTNTIITDEPQDSLISSLLHEVAHNLGPAHDYRVDGKTDSQAFGGPLASTLEEFKAETSAMFLANWLVNKGVITQKLAQEINLYQITWDFGHISRGMYSVDGTPKNYSHLAAMQLGWIIDNGAASWHAQETAANGKDTGCLEIDLSKLPAAIRSMETRVLQIKAQNDKHGAEELKAKYVDGDGDYAKLKDTITERLLRSPKGTLVYSVRF